ncbi:MAG: YjbQ family protein [Roseibium sp.]|nr:YjbQ family protein [Roseibium sp.]
MHTDFILQTRGPGLTDFTGSVAEWLTEVGAADGLLTLFVRHTSCSLLIQENADPDVRTDLAAFFNRLVPSADEPLMGYLTHTIEGPDDMPAHIKAALLPVSLSIPVMNGQMRLGTWQGIYLFEHREGTHKRQVAAQFLKGWGNCPESPKQMR